MGNARVSQKVFSVLALVCILSPVQAEEATCRMTRAFDQRNNHAKSGHTPIWSDAAGNLMFITALNVNTDGTAKSYSVHDFWGRDFALNNLCNAIIDACKGLNEAPMRRRRLATEDAAAAGWPKDKLAATRLKPSIIPMPGGNVASRGVSMRAQRACFMTSIPWHSGGARSIRMRSAVRLRKTPKAERASFSQETV